MNPTLKRKNPFIDEAADRLFEFLRPMGRGDILMFEVMDRIIGGERHRHPWGAVVKRLRRRMQDERGIRLDSENMVGYRLAEVGDQIAHGATRAAQAARRIRWGMETVASVPDEECSSHQRQCKDMQLRCLDDIDRASRQQRRLMGVLLRPREAPPRLATYPADAGTAGEPI